MGIETKKEQAKNHPLSLQLPRYMGIETSSYIILDFFKSIATSSLYGD